MTAMEFDFQIANLAKTLQTFTHRFTHDKEESRDLVQDTILKALTYRNRFKEDTNLKGWLYTIMRNTFINNYRRNQRSRTSRDNTNDLYFLNVEDKHTFSSPASKYEYDDIIKNVEHLKDELQVPFRMHTSGYKYQEIAEHLDIPIGTVKNRIFHARKELQTMLEN